MTRIFMDVRQRRFTLLCSALFLHSSTKLWSDRDSTWARSFWCSTVSSWIMAFTLCLMLFITFCFISSMILRRETLRTCGGPEGNLRPPLTHSLFSMYILLISEAWCLSRTISSLSRVFFMLIFRSCSASCSRCSSILAADQDRKTWNMFYVLWPFILTITQFNINKYDYLWKLWPSWRFKKLHICVHGETEIFTTTNKKLICPDSCFNMIYNRYYLLFYWLYLQIRYLKVVQSKKNPSWRHVWVLTGSQSDWLTLVLTLHHTAPYGFD